MGQPVQNTNHHGILPLHEWIKDLVNIPSSNQALNFNVPSKTELLNFVEEVIYGAYAQNRASDRYALHKSLYYLYEQHIHVPDRQGMFEQFDPMMLEVRSKLESAWISHERSLLKSISELPTEPESFITYFKERYLQHSVRDHVVFDFLLEEASKDQVMHFFKHECALNLRFYDILVLTMVGTDNEVRKELAQNFWDEMGHGELEHSHTVLFNECLKKFGTELDPQHFIDLLGWEGLAGYNLFLYLALHRQNFYLSVGNLAATEMLDPSNYCKLVKGCERIGFRDPRGLAYYKEHIAVDVIHGKGWLKNVISPLLRKNPNIASDLIIGAELRFNTCKRYYDYLLAELQKI